MGYLRRMLCVRSCNPLAAPGPAIEVDPATLCTKALPGNELSHLTVTRRGLVAYEGDDDLYLFVGIFVGREGDPVLVEGVPDLFFALHVDPRKVMGQRLQKDAKLQVAVDKWKERAGNVHREYWPGDWEVLRARASALELVQSTDQPEAFLTWMRARAKEWSEDGILGLVAQIDADTRKMAGEAADADE